jgi:argonaute-like protein implicated in RNA metabolism and viral defense
MALLGESTLTQFLKLLCEKKAIKTFCKNKNKSWKKLNKKNMSLGIISKKMVLNLQKLIKEIDKEQEWA